MAVATLGAVVSAVGAVLPSLDGAPRGFSSAPLLTVLAVAPVTSAWLLLLRPRLGAAMGVLIGAAVLAPAAVVLDLQLVVDPSTASRPELYLPRDLSLPSPSLGLWLLLAGHVLTLAAGVTALMVARGKSGLGAEEDDADVGFPDVPGVPGVFGVFDVFEDTGDWRRRQVLVVFLVAVVGACGLLMAPFHTTSVYLLAQNAFEGPAVELVGHVLSALALSAGAVLLVVLPRKVSVARGGLVGLALALAALGAPPLVAALSMPSLDLAAGPWLVAVAVLGLSSSAARKTARKTRDLASSSSGVAEARLPGRRKLELATGVLALLTGVLATLGAVLPQLATSGPGDAPESPARWLLLAAGVVVGVLGLAMLVAQVAAAVRPVLSVAWGGVPLAATAVLDTALTTGYTGASFSSTSSAQYGIPVGGLLDSLEPGSIGSGPGVVWAWLAMVGAVATACCSVVAGMVEREDAEDAEDAAATEDTEDAEVPEDTAGTGSTGGPVESWDVVPHGLTAVGLRMLIPLTAAALLAVAAFGTPSVTAPEYVEPGLWSDVGAPTWGLAAAVLVVVGACVLAARSRPIRAVALLAGAACVVGLRAATLPLVGGEIDGSSAGPGLWFSLAALVALAGSVAIVAVGRRRA